MYLRIYSTRNLKTIKDLKTRHYLKPKRYLLPHSLRNTEFSKQALKNIFLYFFKKLDLFLPFMIHQAAPCRKLRHILEVVQCKMDDLRLQEWVPAVKSELIWSTLTSSGSNRLLHWKSKGIIVFDEASQDFPIGEKSRG